MTVQSIPIDTIDIIPGHNFRDEFHTEDLEHSMKALGQLQAILVVQREGRYVLNAGERRLRAARNLGWTSIDALVLGDLDEVDLELASIDENIVRRGLQGASLDRALARRKELYITKYPETAQYVAGGKARPGDEEGAGRAPSFTEDTAEKTGKSARTIERSVRRAERLSADTMKAYEDGRLSQTQADIIAALPHAEQDALLGQVIGKSVDETRRLVGGDLKGEGKGSDRDKRPMQLLEELYMHGQKIVAALEKLQGFDGLDEELVESVLQLRETLNDEFDTFEGRVAEKVSTRKEGDAEEAEGADPLEDFPEEPPF